MFFKFFLPILVLLTNLNALNNTTLEDDFLPQIPTTLLYENQIETELEVRYDRIESFSEALGTDYNISDCNVSSFWDSSRVMVGGRAEGRDEDVCKVQITSDTNFDLNFLTKWPINNIHYPLTPEPAWARFRFPVPNEHVADEIEYEISWYKLFGSSPTNCHENERNETTGECQVDVSSEWRDDVDAGIYLFWTTPNSSEQVMTGPHAPIETIGYSGIDTFKVEVPDAYREVQELIVTFVAYNQYTKGCDKDNSSRCTTHENENFRIHAVTLKSEEPFVPIKEPLLSHPRILGDNSAFKAYYQSFDDLNCTDTDKDMGWGVVFNAKNIWDKNTKGVSLCRDTAPTSLAEVSDTAYYLNREEDDSWQRNRALRVLFLLREMMDCYSSGGECLYSVSDVNALKEAFISSEMARFDTVTWDWGYKCFDIGTEPAMKFWSIFVDTFWSDLKSSDKEKIDNKLSEKIGCFMDQVESKDWSIFNGNNWTPILDKAALYWAIAYYHEDSRANDVVKEVLRTLWLHRDFYLEDGMYMEGVVEYTNVSYSNLRAINNLMRQSFGESLASVRWERIEKTTRWYLDFMATDGRMADFGDSWDKRGWSTFDPLHMMLWEEMIGIKDIGSVELDACTVYEYFSNVWFVKGFDDPWSVQPSMARDWLSIVNDCNTSTVNETKSVLFDQAESGVLKSYLPNSSNIGDEESLRFSQADYTWLGFNGVPNDFPHRELDFGALIWTAYGNRLLHDFGYGEIGKTSSNKGYLIEDGDVQLFDNLALGANTLVVEDATIEGYTGGNYDNDLINSSQIYGARGELIEVDLNGHRAFMADGSAVYGRDDETFGWLEYFYRYTIALDDGNFIVVDTFKAKDDRGVANVKEYWHSSDEVNLTSCAFNKDKVELGLENSTTLTLKPVCSMLEREGNSTVSAKIIASSLQEGAFEIEPETIVYQNRNGTESSLKRAKYGSLVPIEEDIRIFLLQATPNGELPNASVSTNQSDELDACFNITIEEQVRGLQFKKVDGAFKIDAFMDTPCQEDSEQWATVSSDDNTSDFNDIQSAFDSNVSKILILDGTYKLSKGLELTRDGVEVRGESVDGVVIEPADNNVCVDLFYVGADYVTISDITIQQNSDCKYAPFVSANHHHITLKDSKIIGSDLGFAVYFSGPNHTIGQEPLTMVEENQLDHHNQVLNNEITSNFDGDVLSFSLQKDGLVSGNTLNGGLIALFLDRNVTCENNILNNPIAQGIFLSLPSYDVTIKSNTILNPTSTGITVKLQTDHMDENGEALLSDEYRSSGIYIEGNKVENARNHGIAINNLEYSVIRDNTIESPDFSGIYLYYSDNIYVAKNNVINAGMVEAGEREALYSGWNTVWDSGIYLEQYVTNCTVSLNTIESNNNLMSWGVAINHHWEGNEGNKIYWNHLLGIFKNEKVHVEVDTPNEKFENELVERTGTDIWVQVGMGKGTVSIDDAEYDYPTKIQLDTISSHTIKAISDQNNTFIGWGEVIECEDSECMVENAMLVDMVALFKPLNSSTSINDTDDNETSNSDENTIIIINEEDVSFDDTPLVDENETTDSDENTTTINNNEDDVAFEDIPSVDENETIDSDENTTTVINNNEDDVVSDENTTTVINDNEDDVSSDENTTTVINDNEDDVAFEDITSVDENETIDNDENTTTVINNEDEIIESNNTVGFYLEGFSTEVQEDGTVKQVVSFVDELAQKEDIIVTIDNKEAETKENSEGSFITRSNSLDVLGILIVSEIEVKKNGVINNRVFVGGVVSEVMINIVGSDIKMQDDGSLEIVLSKVQISSGESIAINIVISKDGIVEINSEKLELPKLKVGSIVKIFEDENGNLKIKSEVSAMDKDEVINF